MFSAMSASSMLVPYQATAKVQQPPKANQPTSLLPSNACAPGHSWTNEGQRVVEPPKKKAKLEVGSFVHVACLFRRACRPAPPEVGSFWEL